MIRILLADDHPIVRQGVAQLIGDAGDLSVAGEASNGTEALDRVREFDFDVLLLDLSMPGPSGLELLKQVLAVKPSIAVLILTVYPEKQYAVRTLRAGAAGYLTKDTLPDELLKAIRTVAGGGKYVSASLAQQLAMYVGDETPGAPHESLSDREFQVMRQLASGTTATAISEQLSLSVKTVSTYRSRILQKMHLTTNAELVRYAIDHGLLDA